MQVDRCRRSGSYQLCSDQHYVVEIEKGVGDSSMSNNFHSISSSSLNSLSSSSSTSSSNSVSPCGVNSIEHYVSKMDTLAGVAIKYGVEVADIKRMNGLVTDLQMFALKTLQIPLPGRHPPSPGLSNGSANQGRQKTDDSGSRTPVTIIKNQDNNGSSGLSSRTTKGLALRPKSSSRIALTADSDSGWLNPIPIGLGDSILANGFDNFRKSSSASNLQEQENYSAYLIRSNSKWSLKPEVIGRPIIDGVPKPSTARRNKAALD
ncbi:hypothetical protein GIB67_036039 [Kingdonia uniflora]|uniref:LysM domain-containing protein n=1 Tax=Kingdonia uniflora TaxID=39325 RepID=A0A7J7N1N2_9MAGN|nr:hypothetical protein GIB67_036039 [Kingdonia uniflora]